MRLLVCGGREWTDDEPIALFLGGLAESYEGRVTVVHGACRGPDRIAGTIARHLGLVEEAHPADWTGQGKSAGFRRNKVMADLGADLVIAFKDGFNFALDKGGTENMILLAKQASIPTLVVSHG